MMMRNGLAHNGSAADERKLGPGYEALRVILAQKEQALEQLENQVTILKANLRLFRAEAYLKLENPATAKNDLANDLHKQEVALKTKLAQIRFMLAQEKKKLERQKQAYLAELAQINSQDAAKLENLKQLKLKVAIVLREEIDKLRAEALREQKVGKFSATKNYLDYASVEQFNKQFLGFAQIDGKGNFAFQGALAQDFSQEPLEVVQEQVGRLLKQSDSTSKYKFGQSEALKKLIIALDNLAVQKEYRALASSDAKEQPFMNGDVRFTWAPRVQELQVEVSSPAVESKHSKLPAKHFGESSALADLNAKVVQVKEALQVFKDLNQEFQNQEKTSAQYVDLFGSEDEDNSLFESSNEKMLLNQTKAKALGEFDKFNDSILSAYYVQNQFDQVEAEQVQAIFAGVSQLRKHLVDLGKTGTLASMSEKEKQLFTKGGMDLYREVARSSYQLLDTVQKIKIAYQGKALPIAVSERIAQAFQKQAGVVQALVEPQFSARVELEEKNEDSDGLDVDVDDLFSQVKEKNYFVPELQTQVSGLKVSVAALSAENIQTSQFCALVIDTLNNSAYWNKQLSFSSVRKTVDAPTGIKEMKNIIGAFYRGHGPNWMLNPALAKQFLNMIQAEAAKRLAYKVCYFFNPGRDAHTTQLYKFLSQLNMNQLTSESFQAAKKVHAIESTLVAKNAEPAQQAVNALVH